MDFQAILICLTVKAMAGLNGLTLGKCRVAVRICREGDVRKNQMWHFPCWGKRILCGPWYSLWQFWSAVQWLWIIQAKCHDGSVLFLKACLSALEWTVVFFFSLHLWRNRSSCLFTIVSCFFLFFFLLPHYHYHYYGGHERRKAKEAYNIRYWSTPITTQRKKTWVQGLHNSDWTVRSIGCSISRCHGNSQSKDRAPAFIYTCLLLPAT